MVVKDPDNYNDKAATISSNSESSSPNTSLASRTIDSDIDDPKYDKEKIKLVSDNKKYKIK